MARARGQAPVGEVGPNLASEEGRVDSIFLWIYSTILYHAKARPHLEGNNASDVHAHDEAERETKRLCTTGEIRNNHSETQTDKPRVRSRARTQHTTTEQPPSLAFAVLVSAKHDPRRPAAQSTQQRSKNGRWAQPGKMQYQVQETPIQTRHPLFVDPPFVGCRQSLPK